MSEHCGRHRLGRRDHGAGRRARRRCFAPATWSCSPAISASGKTTFAQGVGRGLGVTEPVVSPTFTIVREYEGRVPLVHVDVYRLDQRPGAARPRARGADRRRRGHAGRVGRRRRRRTCPRDRLDVRLDAGARRRRPVITLTFRTGRRGASAPARWSAAVGDAGRPRRRAEPCCSSPSTPRRPGSASPSAATAPCSAR